MNKQLSPFSGLYAIADTGIIKTGLAEAAQAVIEGGCRVLQYRDKTTDTSKRRQQAGALSELCHQHNCLFIINDDIALCLESDADGVHIGRNDHTLTQARNRLGTQKLIGVSCYNSLPRAIAACDNGADYIAFGSFFKSTIKPDAVKAELDLIQTLKKKYSIPVIAIGGITLDNANTLIDQGVDMVAVISALFSGTDIKKKAIQFSQLFYTH